MENENDKNESKIKKLKNPTIITNTTLKKFDLKTSNANTTKIKSFNNVNDYSYLFNDLRSSTSDLEWVKILRNFPETPLTPSMYGHPPSFFSQDFEKYQKRFNKHKYIKKSKSVGESGWKALNVSNVVKSERLNVIIPFIDKKKFNNLNESDRPKNVVLHPIKFNFKKSFYANGKEIKQRIADFDKTRELRFPSLIYSSLKFNDRSPIKNINFVYDYLHLPYAIDKIKWFHSLRLKKNNQK